MQLLYTAVLRTTEAWTTRRASDGNKFAVICIQYLQQTEATAVINSQTFVIVLKR